MSKTRVFLLTLPWWFVAASALADGVSGGEACATTSSCDATGGGQGAVMTLATASGDDSSAAAPDKVRPKLSADGTGIRLMRPLETGAQDLNFTAFGQALSESVLEPEGAGWSNADRAIVIETMIRDWAILKFPNDPRVAMVLKALAPLRNQIDLGDLLDNAGLRGQFRNLYLMLRLVSVHGRFASEEDHREMRSLFARASYEVVSGVLNHRAIVKDYPSDERLLAVLARIRDEVPGDALREWTLFCDWLKANLTDSLNVELERQLAGRKSRFVGRTALAAGVGIWAFDLAAYPWLTDHEILTPALIAMVGGPALVGAAVAGWRSWRKPVYLERARDEVDGFVRDCRAHLVGHR